MTHRHVDYKVRSLFHHDDDVDDDDDGQEEAGTETDTVVVDSGNSEDGVEVEPDEHYFHYEMPYSCRCRWTTSWKGVRNWVIYNCRIVVELDSSFGYE